MSPISQSLVRELLDYDPDTGILTWKPRSGSRFASDGQARSWNGQYAGKRAGKLNRNGYRYVTIEGICFREHRIIWLWWYGEWPAQIDHDDRDRGNNRLRNLKAADNAANSRNKKMRSDNSSGVTGVQWSKRAKKWTAEIYVDGIRTYLGSFPDKDDAVEARRSAEQKHGYHPQHGIPD